VYLTLIAREVHIARYKGRPIGRTAYARCYHSSLLTHANGHHQPTPSPPSSAKRKTPQAPKRLRGKDLRFMGLGRVELPTSRLSVLPDALGLVKPSAIQCCLESSYNAGGKVGRRGQNQTKHHRGVDAVWIYEHKKPAQCCGGFF
jgi:hypothetical protein